MPVQPTLPQFEERKITIAKMCGVPNQVLEDIGDISYHTITHQIVGKRSKQWNDPLVEFYRQRLRRVNAVHLYLGYNEFDIENADLIDEFAERVPYKLVLEHIFGPWINRIVTETSLSKFVEPSDGFYQLIKDVLKDRWKNAFDIAHEVLANKLYTNYASNMSVPGNINDSIDQIVQGIKEGGLSTTTIKKAEIFKFLNRLDNKECLLLIMAYGLDCSPKSVEEIAGELSYTIQSVRQMKYIALKNLRKYNFDQFNGIIANSSF